MSRTASHDPTADWNAGAYHRVSEPQFAWGLAVLDTLDLVGDETVLDAGCGTGRLTLELLRQLPDGRVLAVDLSEAMTRRARETLDASPPGRHGRRALVVRADLLALPVQAAVDVVFSTATLHWVLDHETLFAALFGALRPGGRLVAQFGGGPNLATVHARAERLMRRPEVAAHFAAWRDPWEFAGEAVTAERLAAAGFVDVHTSLVPAPTRFETEGEYRDFLTTVVLRPHLTHLPPGPLRDEFVDELTRQALADEPPLTLDYWRLNIRARRPEAPSPNGGSTADPAD